MKAAVSVMFSKRFSKDELANVHIGDDPSLTQLDVQFITQARKLISWDQMIFALVQ